MSWVDRWARPTAVTVTTLGLAFCATSWLTILLSDRVSWANSEQIFQFSYLAYLLGGAVITIARPRNGVGWCLLWLGFATLLGAVIITTKQLLLGPGQSYWYSLESALTSAAVGCLFPLTLLIFPTGRLLTRRWRWVRDLCLVTAGLGLAAGGLSGVFGGHSGNADQDPVLTSPLAVPLAGPIAVLELLFTPIMLICFVGAGVSQIVRYRRSAGDERAQLRWLAWSAGLLVALFVIDVTVVFPLTGELDSATLGLVATPLFCLVPLSVAVAVVKYRLYDIDVVISRSVVFGGLAAFITAVYVLVVVGIGRLVDPSSGLTLPVVATAVVAFAFEPVRTRLQHLANRLVYGRRATPYEVLERLTAGFAEAEREHGADPARLVELLAAGTGAVDAAVWLRVGDRLRRLDDTAEVPVHGEDLPGLAAGHAVAVRDTDGGLLGALSIDKARGDAVTAGDRRLLDDVAGGAALLLRNRRLAAELGEQAARLRESRRRLVAGQDAERRRLERDLHDGAQQHLVALKLKLGIAATLARQEGADGVAGELDALAAATQGTVDGVRAIARSLYPPLLEAEGLRAAVTGASRALGVPVTVRAEGVERLDRVVESTVYFCVVEAMGIAVRAGEPAAITVDLVAGGDQVEFRVTDDGTGSDPDGDLAAIADRLDVLGGDVEVVGAAGRGTTLTGRVPLPAGVGA